MQHDTDFQDFLDEIGVTQAQMDAAALTLPDPVIVVGDLRHPVRPSAIQGLGVFSGDHFQAVDRVCTLMAGKEWTICGRYINHDRNPNLRALVDSDAVYGIALRAIHEGDEITLDYRQVKAAIS
jgi:hypothetical protein